MNIYEKIAEKGEEIAIYKLVEYYKETKNDEKRLQLLLNSIDSRDFYIYNELLDYYREKIDYGGCVKCLIEMAKISSEIPDDGDSEYLDELIIDVFSSFADDDDKIYSICLDRLTINMIRSEYCYYDDIKIMMSNDKNKNKLLDHLIDIIDLNYKFIKKRINKVIKKCSFDMYIKNYEYLNKKNIKYVSKMLFTFGKIKSQIYDKAIMMKKIDCCNCKKQNKCISRHCGHYSCSECYNVGLKCGICQ